MTDQPQDRYRIKGEKGQPNTAFLKIGKIEVEVLTEQEYRDHGYGPDFDELPWNINEHPSSAKESPEHKG